LSFKFPITLELSYALRSAQFSKVPLLKNALVASKHIEEPEMSPKKNTAVTLKEKKIQKKKKGRKSK
jgi:hypothetical protein